MVNVDLIVRDIENIHSFETINERLGGELLSEDEINRSSDNDTLDLFAAISPFRHDNLYLAFTYRLAASEDDVVPVRAVPIIPSPFAGIQDIAGHIEALVSTSQCRGISLYLESLPIMGASFESLFRRELTQRKFHIRAYTSGILTPREGPSLAFTY